jgi:hypothetical protein
MRYSDLTENVLPSWDQFKRKFLIDPYALDGKFITPWREVYDSFEIRFKNEKQYFDWLLNHFNNKPDPVPLHRTLAVRGALNTVEKLQTAIIKTKKPLGVHWSDIVINVSNPNSIVIQASVPKSSIDWWKTITAHFRFPGEREYYVTGPVRINAIYKFSSAKKNGWSVLGDVMWTNPSDNSKLWRTSN